MQVTKYKTPRSLVQYPGRVYSMPQVMDLKFLIMGARLLTRMASASNKVEHKGSTVYNTPNTLVQLGQHGVCDLPGTHNLPILPANSSDTKACALAPSCPATHLQTWVTTKVEQYPLIRLLVISWCPPRDAKNCDVNHVGVARCRSSSYTLPMMLTFYVRNSAHGHQPKGRWSCEDST